MLTSKPPIACGFCKSMAVWMGGHDYFCDDHVPRGCQCTVIEYDINAPSGHPDLDILILPTDDSGKLIPCIEFYYHSEGFDYD